MALSILSNFAANVAHRNLTASDAQASASVAKLSSGLRVLGAKDDAAGLAIGSRLRAEVSAQVQASVNAGQAVSMLQIADGAMSKVNDILVRMKALAVQAGSDQLGDTERTLIDSEFQQLNLEIERIAQDTEFNGQALIKGGSTTVAQAPAISAGNNALDAASGFTNVTFDKSVADAAFEVTYNATNDTLTVTNLDSNTVESKVIDAAAIAAQTAGASTDVKFDALGVTISLNNAFSDTDLTTTASSAVVAGGTGTLAVAAGGITLDSVDIQSATGLTDLGDATNITLAFDTTTNGAAASDLTLAVNGGGNAFTAVADLTGTGSQSVTFTRTGADADGNTVTDTIVLDINVGTAANGAASEGPTVNLGNLYNVAFADQQGTSTTDLTFKIGTGNESFDRITLSLDSVTQSALGLNGLDVTTAANADTASVAVSAAIDTLQSARANVGAFQNRLENAAANLSISRENTEAARSAILDLDVASEIIKFTSTQILVQSGVSMLAQANQLPQNLLRLLQ